MTWAIVIMVGLFVILRALQGTKRGVPQDALERAVAASVDPGDLLGDDDDGDEAPVLATPAPLFEPSVVRLPEPGRAGTPRDPAGPPARLGTRAPSTSSTRANPRTRAIMRRINGKGLCSPRG